MLLRSGVESGSMVLEFASEATDEDRKRAWFAARKLVDACSRLGDGAREELRLVLERDGREAFGLAIGRAFAEWHGEEKRFRQADGVLCQGMYSLDLVYMKWEGPMVDGRPPPTLIACGAITCLSSC